MTVSRNAVAKRAAELLLPVEQTLVREFNISPVDAVDLLVEFLQQCLAELRKREHAKERLN